MLVNMIDLRFDSGSEQTVILGTGINNNNKVGTAATHPPTLSNLFIGPHAGSQQNKGRLFLDQSIYKTQRK